MKVRAKKAAPRYKGAEPTSKQMAEPHTFPAPIRGWVLNENLANPSPGGALILDNWICTTTGIKLRGGCDPHITLPAAVESLFGYRNSVGEKMFGATGTAIYDVSTESGSTPSAAVSGQTEGYYSTEQFGTTGGEFLYAVNGADDAQLYDGTSWQSVDTLSTPIAITGKDTSTFSQVWSYGSRLFFIEKDSLSAWYLPVDSVGGMVTEFPMAGLFKLGGTLMFGAAWSLDAGDGLDDKCVFVSSEGEVVVYEGTNPGSAADWRKVGTYLITKPLGRNAVMQAGGDLLIATEIGLVPISQAVRRDVAALEVGAVSYPISPHWQSQVNALGSSEWEIIKWASENIMIVSQPTDPDSTCLMANLQTGAWSRVTGWDTRCIAHFDGSGFFGSANGKIYRMQDGGSDDGLPYTCAYLGQHESLGRPGVEKFVGQANAVFQAATSIAPYVSAQVNYSKELGAAPNSAPDGETPSAWDTALWDSAIWDGGLSRQTSSAWSAVGRTGYALAPEVQLTIGSTTAPDVELVEVNVTYQAGAMVT